MKLESHIHEGLLNLFSSKLRSILTLLGILVGTASVVAMVSGGQLATNEALKQFKTLGTDLLAVSISDNAEQDPASSSAPENKLTLEEAENVYKSNASIVKVAPYTQAYSPIQYNSKQINGNVLGVTESFADIVHINMMQGRFISILDGYKFYCVIGHGVYNDIRARSLENPIGKQIQIGKDFFTIIGIADNWPENSFVYANINNAVLVPVLASTALSKYAMINNIIMRLTPHADIPTVQMDITNYINAVSSHKSLFFRSAEELISHMKKQSEILTIFLGLIGSVSLLVGGIGVMNIMLVSVVERRREIGIRLAVGAKRADIRRLFLVEAIMLALVGGTIGVILGMLVAYIIAVISHWQFTLFLLPPLIGFTVSAATGIFFGYYPAYKASQLDPIEALRSE